MVYDSKGIGERSEAVILATFLLAGKVVLQPFGDNQRYDLVVHENNEFIRVQCKTACLSKDKTYFEFPTSSQNWNSKIRRDYKGEIDIFAVYFREKNQVYIFDVNKVPKTKGTVRLNGAKCRQKMNVRLADDYEFNPNKYLRDHL